MINKMKKNSICLIGIGRWGQNHLRILDSLKLLSGVYDLKYNNLKDKKIKIYKNISEIIEDKNVKGVIIATPPDTHYEIASKLVKKKIPVLIEKPVCLNLSDTLKLNKLSKKNKTITLVGHLLFFHSAFQMIKKILKDNIIGKVNYIESNRLNLGKIRKNEDILWSFAPHDISMITNIVDNQYDSIKSMGMKISNSRVSDVSTTLIKYKSILAKISVSWLHYEKVHEFFILGKKGMIIFNDTNSWGKKLKLIKYKINKNKVINSSEKFLKIKKDEPLKKEIIHFVDIITGKQKDSPIFLDKIIPTMKILNVCSRQISK